MHTGLLILLWAAGIVVLQILSGPWLLLVVGAYGLVAFAAAPVRCRRLLRRVRFLLLAIFVFFAGFTPGEALFPAWPQFGPSRDGVLLALQHGARLIGVVFGVALLLDRLSVDRLVSGLYALLRPIEAVGLPAERMALRLLLVMRYVESGPRRGWASWLDEPDDAPDEAIHLGRDPLRPAELILSALCAAVAVALAAGVLR